MREKQSPFVFLSFSLQNFIISNSKALKNEIQISIQKISFLYNFEQDITKHLEKYKRRPIPKYHPTEVRNNRRMHSLLFSLFFFFYNPEAIFTSNVPFHFIDSKSSALVVLTFNDFIVFEELNNNSHAIPLGGKNLAVRASYSNRSTITLPLLRIYNLSVYDGRNVCKLKTVATSYISGKF